MTSSEVVIMDSQVEMTTLSKAPCQSLLGMCVRKKEMIVGLNC